MRKRMKQISTLLLAASMSLSMVMGNAMAIEEVTEEVAYEEISEEYVEEMEVGEENLGEESPEEEATIIVDDFVYEEENLEEEAGDAEEVILEVAETEEMTDAAALEEEEPQMSGKCGENVTYQLTKNSDGYTLTISGSGDMWDFCSYSEEIGDWVNDRDRPWGEFSENVTQVIVNSGVTGIGNDSFALFYHLNSVSLPDGLKKIGFHAFFGCQDGEAGLKEITIPSTVTSIGLEAFASCGMLTKVNYAGEIANICPNGTYDNGDAWDNQERVWQAFRDTPFGENYRLSGQCGDNVTYQLTRNSDSFKFYNDEEQRYDTCTDCYTLTISGSGDMWNFCKFSEEQDDWVDENVRPWDEFRWSVTRLVVNSGVTGIGDGAFAWFNHVNSVSLPSGLKKIGAFAFHNCTDGEGEDENWHATGGLKEIAIPSTVTSIERGAFSDCQLLTKANYSGEIANVCPNGTYEDGNSWGNRDRVWEAFWNTPFAENYGLSGKCGDNLTYELTRNSDSFKFYNDQEQKYETNTDCYTLTISGSGPMWNYAYSWNDNGVENREKPTPWDEFRWNITRIVVNSGVTEIGEFAFMCSHHVNSVSLPNGLKKIGANAFQGSTDGEGEGDNWHATSGLKEITIPSTVTSIDFGAFSDCGMLTKVNYAGEIADICPSGEDDGIPWNNKIRVMTAFWGSPFAENYLPWNAITVNKDTVSLKANAAKAQSFTLGAANTAKLPMKYSSSSSSVKVDASGKVTIAKNFAGAAKITITTAATEEYQAGTKVVTVKVAKLTQPMKVSASTTSVKLSTVKKKAQKVTLKVRKAQGKVTYTSSSKKYVTVSSKGVVTLKKGTPKGTYKITVKAAGKGIYDAGSKVISIKVK